MQDRMDVKNSVLVFVIIPYIFAERNERNTSCPSDQEFQSCGSACPKTCKSSPDEACTAQCVTGCFCKPPLVLNTQGQCIHRSRCPKNPVCPADQEYRSCGSACPDTCNSPPIRACTKQCVPGCFCKSPLVLDAQGKCIHPSACPGGCPPDQEYQSCGPSCPDTCDSSPDRICTEQCVAGCFCKPPLVLDSQGKCIPRSRCPGDTSCPPDQEFRSCGSACSDTCSYSPRRFCSMVCVAGCFCKPPLVRNAQGKCICPSKCPGTYTTGTPMPYQMSCGLHQQYRSCQRCERTCSDVSPPCGGGCRAGCFCQEGYVKAPSGQCVELKDCPKAEMSQGVNELTIEECLSDEVFVFCGWCEGTCSDPNPHCPEPCTLGCLCRPPLLRHSSGHCVEERNCTPQKCSDSNEEFGCRYGCEATCAYRACIRPRRCRLGCHCRLGLLRNSAGKCVPAEQCSIELNNTLITL